MKIICTKCKSENIENRAKELPKIQYQTFDEFINDTGAYFHGTPLVMVYTPMILSCHDCGYQVEYTEPRGSSINLNV